MDNFILWVWLLSCPIAIAVCGWMIVDLWLDRQALDEAGLNGPSHIQNTAAIRLEILTILKAIGLWVVGIISAYFTWVSPIRVQTIEYVATRDFNDIDQFLVDYRMIITRICIVVVVTLGPIRAIADRRSRMKAGVSIRRALSNREEPN